MPAWGSGSAHDAGDSWKLVRFIRHLPELTADEEAEMQGLNPKGPDELKEEQGEKQFLNGDRSNEAQDPGRASRGPVACAPANIATAHGGEEHVTGTVAGISDTSVTVKTMAGKTIEVGFDPKMTTCVRAKQPIQKTDIKAGDRVVIHAMEVNEKLVAHRVEVGAAKQAAKQ